MSKVKALAKELPASEGLIQVDIIGLITKTQFRGEFVCKIPNIKYHCMIEKHNAFLNGEMALQLPEGVLKIHRMISYLRYTLMEPYPKFWRESDLGYELQDSNVIEDIYDKVMDFEDKYLKAIWGDDEPKRS